MSANILPPILEDSVGPYFPQSYASDFPNDLTRFQGLVVKPKGTIIRLEGMIRDVDGAPVAPVLVEFWQANAAGRHRTPLNHGDPELDPWFDGFARHYAETGRYQLTTVLPGAIDGDPANIRAPHITLTIFADGISKLITQIFFAGDPRNAGDPLLSSLPPELATRLIAEPVGQEDGIAVFRRDIIMRGDQETPFFDDMDS